MALLAGRSRVLTQEGKQLNEAFISGAEAALTLARANGLELALLKANSPSCGNVKIHNGEFSGTLVAGMGVTAALLTSNGIRVFNETQLDELASRLEQLDNNHT